MAHAISAVQSRAVVGLRAFPISWAGKMLPNHPAVYLPLTVLAFGIIPNILDKMLSSGSGGH